MGLDRYMTTKDAQPLADYLRVADDVILGQDVQLSAFVNAYGCTIGERTKVGAFVEIQKDVTIGPDCKISSHTFVCEGVTLGRGVFVGHGVIFTNDRFPAACTEDGTLKTSEDWQAIPTVVEDSASLGSGCTILCGVTIGAHSLIGAGSVVVRSVPPREVWAGNPARFLRGMDPQTSGGQPCR
ncbi:MAG: acyltransferase [Planctomycetota bacterium]|jgi:acetyltransferase-like isoleucine patch superfamily enzyme|nr:acyltransferase [Planctomycetota bacterium]